MLAPFLPHLTEEIWHDLGHATSIHQEPWPSFDKNKIQSEETVIAVQLNGKTKGTVKASRHSSEEEIKDLLLRDEKMAHIVPKNPKRVVFVQGRIINFIA
jgi:leucyl-tRNA synthetase